MRPNTQYEIDGRPTTTSVSYDLINSISLDTEATVEVIGYSYLENPIHAITIGSGNSTLLISGGVHRNEWLAREAVISKMLDVAYNNDGKYTEYLNSHKVVFIPTVQPDLGMSRVNAQNIDINRDFFELQTKEAQAIVKKMTSLDIDIFADFHERSGSLDKIEFVRTNILNPNVDYSVKSGTVEFLDYIMSDLTARGIDNGFYPDSIASSSNSTSVAGLLGAISVTTETFTTSPNTEGRYQHHTETFDLILNFHATNKILIQNMRANFTPSPYFEPIKFFVFRGGTNYYLSMEHIEIETPKGYKVNSDISELSKWIDAYNIVVEDGNYISANQKSGAAIIHLMENRSEYQIAGVEAKRVEFPKPDRRLDGRYTKVKYGAWREIFIKNFL